MAPTPPPSLQQRQELFPLEQVPQQQQQQQQQSSLEDEYLSAQRAAAEAVSIGRETLEVVEQQGEQLEQVERAADDTKYMLEKSNRILRGMTWSGWVTNMFTKDPAATSSTPVALASRIIPKVYEADQVPLMGRAAAQAVQNYHANLAVLFESTAALSKQQQQQPSSTLSEQVETCQMICDNMFQVAWLEVSQLQQNCSVDVVPFCQRLALDLAALRERQKKLSNNTATTATASPTSPAFASDSQNLANRNALLGQQPSSSSSSSNIRKPAAAEADAISHPHFQRQEEHLDFMSGHLDELRNLAHSLSNGLEDHNERLENLHDKADDNWEISKLVTRRADRLIQAKSWSKPRAAFHSFISIRHIDSGYYLAVTPESSGNLVLLPSCLPETCIFSVWKRGPRPTNDRSSSSASSSSNAIVGLFGLQHQSSKKWAGQSFLLGTLSCTATKFGQREEWEAGDDWTCSTLLCASAGWGHGAYLEVASNGTVRLGSSGTAEARTQAARWCLTELAAARHP